MNIEGTLYEYRVRSVLDLVKVNHLLLGRVRHCRVRDRDYYHYYPGLLDSVYYVHVGCRRLFILSPNDTVLDFSSLSGLCTMVPLDIDVVVTDVSITTGRKHWEEITYKKGIYDLVKWRLD